MASIAASPLDRLYELLNSYKNNIEEIDRILAENKGLDLEHGFTDSKDTLLMTAALKASLRIVELFIAAGSNVNAVNSRGRTPLHCALLIWRPWNYTKLAALLIENGAKVNVSDKYGDTPLHYAAYTGDEKTLNLLIDKKADVNAVNISGETPLYEALVNNEKLTKLLIDKGAKVNVENKEKITPLHVASRFASYETVKLLIDKKADVNAVTVQDHTPLYYAASKNKIENAKLLIDEGANVDWKKDGKNLLSSAVKRRNIEYATFFINKGANVMYARRKSKKTPLHDAAENGSLDIAKLLINEGSEVDLEDKDGRTPLHYAAGMGGDQSFEIVRLLIEAGANVNKKNNDGETALSSVARLNDLPLAIYLVEEAGADVTFRYKDDFDKSVLFYEFANDAVVKRSLAMLYEQYRFLFLSRKLGGHPAGVGLGFLKY